MKICWQVNLQTGFGGGELYTRFTCEALARIGWRVKLVHHRRATFLSTVAGMGIEMVPVEEPREIITRLPDRGALVLTHNNLDAATTAALAARHRMSGLMHMPLHDRCPPGLPHYSLLFAVSNYVLESMRRVGLSNCYAQPLLGIADLSLRGERLPLQQRSPYQADPRKVRDRVLASISETRYRLVAGAAFARSPGLTLGIVSRLTPIKQFPLLFSIIAPILASRPNVRLEVFGAGGYRSVRELKDALAPLGNRARFWGHQSDVASVYRNLDYVLSGLPEKEALGLNLVEAQAAGTPVIAVRAPPFTETVIDRITGFLYRDPREDRGMEFRDLIDRILGGAPRPEPFRAPLHLAQFSLERFSERLSLALDSVPPRAGALDLINPQ